MGERQLYISTGAFDEPDLEAIFKAAKNASVSHIELSSGVSYNAENLAIVRRHVDEFTFLIHNYFPAPEIPFVLNLASVDKENLARSLSHCRQALDLTAEFGAPFFAAHAGFAAALRVEQLGQPFSGVSSVPREQAYEIFIESVKKLVTYARERGVAFYIENNVIAPFNAPEGKNKFLLLCDPDEIISFYDDLGDPDFGFLMDVGHLNVSAATLGFDRQAAMDALLPYIRAFHLSENDGSADTNDPFEGDAWFLPWIKSCSDAETVLEAYNLSKADLDTCRNATNDFLI
jgi:sugar phosphate isomerase/epimerase